jgi:hypothetical protein
VIKMNENIRLRAEPCSVCKSTIALAILSEDLKPDITGLDIFVDMHGIEEDPSHIRILYIDAKGFVRSIKTLTKFANYLRKE